MSKEETENLRLWASLSGKTIRRHLRDTRRTFVNLSSTVLRVGLCLIIVCTNLTFASAQQINATVAGQVVDERGDGIVGAAVNVESLELAVKRGTKTNEEGFFTVPNLPVGVYKISVEAQGFNSFTQESVKLDVGSTFNLTVKLSVGGVAQSVEVTAQEYQSINKETANVETLIAGSQVTELALNGRNWAQLLGLAPGASAINNDSQQGTNVRIDDIALNGLRRRSAPTIDGASNVDHGSVGTQVNNISVDAIQEFKLVSSPYSAEYGAQAGPAINVVTKRGTTQYHGSVFEFFRHDALNAFSWESKQRPDPEKPRLRYNNFGFFVGGPIYKEKLFFFGGLEFKRPRTGQSLSQLVPTLAMRRGDFSAFLPVNVPANNTSCTPAGVTQTATQFILCDKSVSTTGRAFPGNIIPQSKLSPNGLALLNLFPEPNSGTDRFIAAPVTVRNVRQELLRVDYQLNQNASFFGRYLRDRFDSDNPLGSTFDNQRLPIAPDNHIRDGKTALFSYTQIVSPTLLNEVNVAWQRNDQSINYQDPEQINRNTYGINFTEIYPENRLNKIPEFTVQGYTTISGNGLPYNIKAQSWEVRDNATKSLGAHTLKFGMLYTYSFKSENTRVRDGGTISFDTAAQVSNFRAQDSGHAVANLLLGAFTRYTETSNTSNAPASYNQWEFYANDQWRVHPRLSLTLGLRYQYIPWPQTDLHNIVGFDASRFDPDKAPLTANITSAGTINLVADPTGLKTRALGFYDPYNGLVIAGCDFPSDAGINDPNLKRLFDCRPSGLARSGNRNFAPRFGFAYDPRGDGKTSIRGGAGIYYDRTLLNPIRDAGVNIPFAQTATVTNGRQYTTPASVVPTFSNPLDSIGAGGAGVPRVQTLSVFSFNMSPGVVYAYSLGVQRQLGWATILDVSYVGNQARHLTHRTDINYVRPEIALQRKADGTFVNPSTDTARQFLGYSAIRQQENTGVSGYNSLQMSVQKRFTQGFTASAAYTYSKALNNFDTETSDLRVPFAASLDKGYADFDRRQVLAVSYVYELPFFKSQHGFTGKLLGGWEVSGITTIQSGRHVNISGGARDATAPSIGYGGNLELVGDWRAVPGGQSAAPVFVNGVYSSGGWINRDAFKPRLGLIGSVPRNLIELPAVENWNVSFMKRTKVTENVKIQFRGELFNFFNHPNFRTLVTDFSASNFGALTETDEPRVVQFGLKIIF